MGYRLGGRQKGDAGFGAGRANPDGSPGPFWARCPKTNRMSLNYKKLFLALEVFGHDAQKSPSKEGAPTRRFRKSAVAAD
jgi:hypothetical protein